MAAADPQSQQQQQSNAALAVEPAASVSSGPTSAAPGDDGGFAKVEGPVLTMMSKRLRALRKKMTKIGVIEESKAAGKVINKEQEDVLKSKSTVLLLIDEYEKLKHPLQAAVKEEVTEYEKAFMLRKSLEEQKQHQETEDEGDEAAKPAKDEDKTGSGAGGVTSDKPVEVSDAPSSGDVDSLVQLLYFAALFDLRDPAEAQRVKWRNEQARNSCLSYDPVTDDDVAAGEGAALLTERDLNAIAALGRLLTSRVTGSSATTRNHEEAVALCTDHAHKLLNNSRDTIDSLGISYSQLRTRLNRIVASGFFTTGVVEMGSSEQEGGAQAVDAGFGSTVPDAVEDAVPVETPESPAVPQEEQAMAEATASQHLQRILMGDQVQGQVSQAVAPGFSSGGADGGAAAIHQPQIVLVPQGGFLLDSQNFSAEAADAGQLQQQQQAQQLMEQQFQGVDEAALPATLQPGQETQPLVQPQAQQQTLSAVEQGLQERQLLFAGQHAGGVGLNGDVYVQPPAGELQPQPPVGSAPATPQQSAQQVTQPHQQLFEQQQPGLAQIPEPQVAYAQQAQYAGAGLAPGAPFIQQKQPLLPQQQLQQSQTSQQPQQQQPGPVGGYGRRGGGRGNYHRGGGGRGGRGSGRYAGGPAGGQGVAPPPGAGQALPGTVGPGVGPGMGAPGGRRPGGGRHRGGRGRSGGGGGPGGGGRYGPPGASAATVVGTGVQAAGQS